MVHLTAAGMALIESALANHKMAMEEACRGLTREERGQAIALLKKLGRYAAGDGGEGT